MEVGQVLAPLARLPREASLRARAVSRGSSQRKHSQFPNRQHCSPVLRSRAAARFVRARASIRSSLKLMAAAPKSRASSLACETSNPSVHKNYSMLYSSHISWSSPTTPTPLELYPALAFDRLFKDASSPEDQSVLDAVLAEPKICVARSATEINRSWTNTSTAARDRNADRECWQARRVARFEANARQAEHRPPSRWHPAEHRRAHAADDRHSRPRFSDRHDARRVAQTEQRSQRTLRFPNLKSVEQAGHGIDYMIHHLLSHSDGRDWLKVNQFFMEQLAYMAERWTRFKKAIARCSTTRC